MIVAFLIFLILIVGLMFLCALIQCQACDKCPFYDKCKQLMDDGEPNLCEQNNMNNNIWNNQTNCL